MPANQPRTPQSFVRSLKDRARNASKITGVPASELVDRYYHRRLLARVFHSDQDGWVLKGGQALLVRWPRARYSTDVDLLRTGDGATADDAIGDLVGASAIELDDCLRFIHHDTSSEITAGQPTRKVRFKAMYGLKQLAVVSVDVVVAETKPHGKILVEPLEAPFTVDDRTWPDIQMWPLEDHVADKVVAMYERHRKASLPSTRYKDLVDLVLIACNSNLDGTVTHSALHAEVRRRIDAGRYVTLPACFEVPDPSWASGYRAQAVHVHGLPDTYRSLEGAVPLADAFITPLLQAHPPEGGWTPGGSMWA